MKNIIIKLCKITLGLLGIAMVDSCIGRAEYGCPHADFEAKGVVTDEAGNGIQGIRVVISAKYPNPYYTGAPLTDTLWTNQEGAYVTGESYMVDDFAYMDSVKLEFEDVDGCENGGEFQSVIVEVPVFQVKPGDGNWYDGAYEAGANVTMIKK
jgi:putative lipoprotein (rSAM/lipoprotein system)